MPGYQCNTCGQHHEDLPMVLGYPAPEAWYAIPVHERESRTLLSSDQCVIDDRYFFVLGRLQIPVLDSDHPFTWLVWVSLSKSNFDRACALWDKEGRESEPPYFAWLQSQLPYASGTVSLKTNLVTQPLGERPRVQLEPTDHPLSLEQQHGIDMARVQAIVEASLHVD